MEPRSSGRLPIKYLPALLALPLALGVLAALAPVQSFTERCGSLRADHPERGAPEYIEARDVQAVHLPCAEARPVAKAWARQPWLSYRPAGSGLDFYCRYIPRASALPRTVCSRGSWQRVEFEVYSSSRVR